MMKKAIDEVKGTTERKEFYLMLPGKHVYFKNDRPLDLDIVFTEFSTDAKPFTIEEASKIAEKYGLEIIEITVKTTIEIDRKVVRGVVEK